MPFNNLQLVARFVSRGIGQSDASNLTEQQLDAIADQAIVEFNVFIVTCDNTSKETQLKSIDKYFSNKGLSFNG